MSKTKQRERPNECITLMAHSVYALCRKGILYAHTWGFCVARFDISGNARAFIQWNEQAGWLHVFIMYARYRKALM